MRGTFHVVAACAAAMAASACGTGDTRIDPGDLELRDLLGVSPEAAGAWDVEQRESARRVLVAALDDAGEHVQIDLVGAPSIDDAIARSLAQHDARRADAGESALGFVRVAIAGSELSGTTREAPTVSATAIGGNAPVLQLALSERWGALPSRSREVLAALAVDGAAIGGGEGASERELGGRIDVVPVPRLTVIASYVAPATATDRPRIVVNPVLLAALDPDAAGDLVVPVAAARAAAASPVVDTPRAPITESVAGGNPYSFYGSVAECAYAQRTRCESCLAAANCDPVTTANSGTEECTRLGENNGRGYFLLCINLSLSITSVNDCSADEASGCARDNNAASDLGQLEANASFLDDATCSAALDTCLARIYGEPKNPFPGPIDGGVDPVDPPRDTDVTCSQSCDSDSDTNNNCDCTGPSCGSSGSCDSACSTNSCGSCDDDSGGGGGGGGCSSDSGGSSGGDCGGSCGSCSSDSGGSSSGGSCGSCGSDSGGSSGGGGGDCGGGGSCGGGGCSGGGCDSGGGGGGGCSGGGGGGGCSVAAAKRKAPSGVLVIGLSVTWALLPVPIAALIRRRARKRRQAATTDASTEEVTR